MTTQRVQIIVSQKGAVTVKKDIDNIGKSADKSAKGVDFLKGALAAFVSVQTFRTFADITSSLTDFQSRLQLTTGSAEAASAGMMRLFELSEMTYSSFDQTAEVFLRNQQVLASMNKTTEDAFKYTQALNDALVISGAKGDEAARVQNALNKALATGTFEMDGLQTVMNSGSEVATLLAKELGINRNELLKFENRAKLTREVIFNSLVKPMDDLRARAEEMPATINDGFLRIQVAFQKLIFVANEMSGASSTLAAALVWVADNMALIAIALTPVAAAFTLFAVQVIGTVVIGALTSVVAMFTGVISIMTSTTLFILTRMIPAFVGFVATLVTAVIPAVISFTTALVTNPLFALGAVAIVAGVVLLKDKLYELGVAIKDTVTGLADLEKYGDFLNGQFNINVAMEEAAKQMSGAISQSSQSGANAMKNGIEQGAANGAAALASAQNSAMARYEQLNGKAVQEMGSTMIAGGDYMYNQVTDSVQKASPTMKENVAQGGEIAGETMQQSIAQGGNSMASSFEIAGMKVSGWLAEALIGAIEQTMRAQRRQIIAEAQKLTAEAQAISRGNDTSGRSSNYGGLSSGGGSTGSYSFGVPDRVKAAEKANQTTTVQSEPKISVVNVIDPNAAIASLDTAEGHKQIINIMKYNSEELKQIMGTV